MCTVGILSAQPDFGKPGARGGNGPSDERRIARERAAAAWDALVRNFAVPNTAGQYHGALGEPPGKRAYVWAQAEIFHAALDLAQVAPDKKAFEKIAEDAAAALADYKLTRPNGPWSNNPGTVTTGYSPVPHSPKNSSRLRDDNGVTGLAFLQAAYQLKNPKHYRDLAAEIFPFYESGQKENCCGVYWQEDDKAPNLAVSATGTDDEVALRLHLLLGSGEPNRQSPYRTFAERNAKWLDHALLANTGPLQGLYFNSWVIDARQNPTRTGNVNEWMFNYNQGFVLGTDVLLFRITHDRKHLEHATALAKASLDYWSRERLWKEAAPFNAYFFRNLLVLDHYAPDPRYRQYFAAYLDRVWQEGRDPTTGLLTAGGVGLYTKPGDPPTVLNQAMFVQMFALFAWPDERLPNAT
jgi:hypothetical protein